MAKCTKVEWKILHQKDGMYKNNSSFAPNLCYNNDDGKEDECRRQRSPYEQYFIFFDTKGNVSPCI